MQADGIDDERAVSSPAPLGAAAVARPGPSRWPPEALAADWREKAAGWREKAGKAKPSQAMFFH